MIWLYNSSAMMLFVLSMFFLFMGTILLVKLDILVMEIFLCSLSFYDLKLYFFIDWMASYFIFIVFFISSMVLFYSKKYMEDVKDEVSFIILTLMFIFSMFIMVISMNIFLILLGWDGLGLVSYCLVIFYKNEYSNYAGILTLLTNRIGDLGMIFSIIFFLNFSVMDYYVYDYSQQKMILCMLFLLMGVLTKSAQMPFSAWLPAAMAAPTPISSLVHSSTLVTAGVYLVIRMMNFFQDETFLSFNLFYLSVMTMFMAGLVAMVEMDMKKVIAYSTLSQLGVMMMSLFLGLSNLAFFHLLMHALFKAMLFLCAGSIIHYSLSNQDLRNLGKFYMLNPFNSMMVIFSSLALGGFPYLSGFYSKDMLLECLYMMNSNFLMLMIIILSTFFTMFYSLRLIYYSLLKGSQGGKILVLSKMENLTDYPIFFMSMMVMVMGSVLSWMMFPHPFFINLSLFMKLLNIYLVIFVLMLFFYVFLFNFNKELFIFKFIMNFLGSMWFLPNLNSKILYPFMSKMLFYQKISESGWLEVSSWFLINDLMSFFSLKILNISFLSLKSYLMVIFIFMTVIMLL